LTAQKLAETSATLNDAGAYQMSGGIWSDVFTYDARSNLTQVDPAGLKATSLINPQTLNLYAYCANDL
jgi:hypothetical protein